MKPRPSRLRRAWDIWLVLPEILRIAVLLIAVFLSAIIAGSLT
jgi:hypothetical protein